MHQRVARISEVQATAGELARTLDRLHGVAVCRSAEPEAVELWFMSGGRWLQPQRFSLAEAAGAGRSMDQRLRELIGRLEASASPDLQHLAILMRWHQSSWRDGEWLSFDAMEKVPYRKLVNAIGRVSKVPKANDQNKAGDGTLESGSEIRPGIAS